MIWYFLIGAGILVGSWMFTDWNDGNCEGPEQAAYIVFLFFLWPLWLFMKAAEKVADSSGWAKREK